MIKAQKKYEFAVIATDVVILTIRGRSLQALLIKMKKKPFASMWAAPGGLVKPGESVDAAAKRHLAEKAGVKNVYLEQLYAFGRVDRDPFGRVVSVAYFALVPPDGVRLSTTEEYGDVRFFPVDTLPALAYDHREVIETAIRRLKSKIGYTNIAYSLLPHNFTLTELQDVYEIILGRPIDKRNFRKKLSTLRLVQPTGKRQSGAANRPAALYRFATRKVETVEIL